MRRGRLAVLVAGVLALAVAGWAGLARVGVVPPIPFGDAGTGHGALMVSGFVGTLVALERAVVVRRWWADLAPVLSALGAIGLIAGVSAPLPALAVVLAALILVAVNVRAGQGSAGMALLLMAIGAAAWAVGAMLWAGGADAHRSMPWWLAFLVLTIAGERFELSRALRPSPRATVLFAAACGTFVLGVLASLVDFGAGLRLAGAGLLVLALWLGLRDRAPAASRALELPRYIAAATALAYAWLFAAGALMATFDGIVAGWRYDAMVHAALVGFVISMIFAHAPIIVPGIVGGVVRFRTILYVPLALLHASLVLRVVGDVTARADWRDWGGLLSGISILVFLLVMASSLRPRRAASRAALAAARRP
ncbi:MAG TPA: hypothetical protein VMQ78_07895 [Candidatus Limnocylindria bacterium]|nr:hypothetical protein [Candidatus Limnocylindria bacterium]